MNYLAPAFLLRMGLAATFLYAAISGFVQPDDWVGFFPEWLRALIPAYLMLLAFGVFEIAVALALIFNKYTYWAAHLYALTMVGIVIANPGALIITFRDIGLAFAGWALAALSSQKFDA
jgi:uncharacterized membrane protein